MGGISENPWSCSTRSLVASNASAGLATKCGISFLFGAATESVPRKKNLLCFWERDWHAYQGNLSHFCSLPCHRGPFVGMCLSRRRPWFLVGTVHRSSTAGWCSFLFRASRRRRGAIFNSSFLFQRHSHTWVSRHRYMILVNFVSSCIGNV
jgi:hypothetical protein